jgi:ABC-type sugar transport system ATPase subunit
VTDTDRPKSLRLLPRITADAVRLVWAANPGMLAASIGLKLVNGAGLAIALIFGRNLIGSVLSADTAASPPGIGAVAPELALVVGIIAALGLVTAAGREVREILSETTARHAKQAIIDVARRVELSAYETPAFHDRLVRAASGEHRPIQMVDGLIGTVGAVASIGGIVAAPLIILDEPTASLDPRAEHDLFSRIRTLYKGRTVLLISHRYNTVREADHIYVLDRGRIIEHGSHDELIAAAGTYAELFGLQAAAYTGSAVAQVR